MHVHFWASACLHALQDTVNFQHFNYTEYIWLLGFKIGEKISFSSVDYWYLTQTKTAQNYGLWYLRNHVKGYHYNLYLKLDDHTKLFIRESHSKKKLLDLLKRLNANQKIQIKDFTETGQDSY